MAKIKSLFEQKGVDYNNSSALATQSSTYVNSSNPNAFKFKRSVWNCPTCKLDVLTIINGFKDNNTTIGIDANVLLMLSYSPKKGETWDKDGWVKINQNNIYKYKDYLDEIISWFTLEKYNDLFYTSDGHLYFNLDYKDMELVLTDGYIGKISRLKTRPNVITYFNTTKECEGVVMFIDKSSNICEISFEALRALRHALETFSFQTELQIALNAYYINMKGENKNEKEG